MIINMLPLKYFTLKTNELLILNFSEFCNAGIRIPKSFQEKEKYQGGAGSAPPWKSPLKDTFPFFVKLPNIIAFLWPTLRLTKN